MKLAEWTIVIRAWKKQNIAAAWLRTNDPSHHMKLNKLATLATLLAAATYTTAALSSTVTFEDVPVYTHGSFASGGYDFVLSGVGGNVTVTNGCGSPCPENGTHVVLAPYGEYAPYGFGPSSLQMISNNGAFSLNSFDGAGSFNFSIESPGVYSYNIPTQINVVGVVVGGGTVTQSFALNRTSVNGRLPFTEFHFSSSFTNLVSATFSSSGAVDTVFNGFTVDNINVSVASAVPEPETYAMLLAGMGVMAAVIRRRKAKQG